MENLVVTEEKNIGTYEISFLQKSEDGKTIVDSVKSFGGVVVGEQRIVKIRSAYPIKKEGLSFLGVIRFSMERDAVNRFAASLKLNGDVLRSIVRNVNIRDKESVERIGQQTDFRGRMQIKKGVVRRRYDVDSQAAPILSNEALEKKIEEILQ